jgi:hypothetical protein
MEWLQRIGAVIAIGLLGAAIVSLFGGFQTAIAQPVALAGGIFLGAAMIYVLLRVMLVPESRNQGWVRAITNRNARVLFTVLLFLWIGGMAFLASLNLPANTVGAPALIGLFAGFFIFMGFIWAVISD